MPSKPRRVFSFHCWQSANASKFIKPIDHFPKDKPAILLARVSDRPQAHNGNLKRSLANLRREVKNRGIKIAAEFAFTISRKDNPKLTEVAEKAIELDAGGIIAESLCRFQRHPDFDPVMNFDARPREVDLRYLDYLTLGVPKFTILDPNATNAEIRDYQIRRGIEEKKKIGTKNRKQKCIETVKRLANEGMSLRKITEMIENAYKVRIHYSTTSRWIKS